MDVPHGVRQALGGVLAPVGGSLGVVFVDGARDDVEVEPLGLARLVNMNSAGSRGCRSEPLVDGQAVALRLGDLLALLVEEELVVEALGRQAVDGADAIWRA
jgi:hypothetical protein